LLKHLSPILLALLCTAALAQQTGAFTDPRDNKTYKTVKIGEQVWMGENLNYEAEVSRCYGEGGQVAYEDAYRTLSNSEIQANCVKYGRMYNWNTAMKACPKDWHLPSKDEWAMLTASVSGEDSVCKHLKAKSGWENDGNGLNSYGFSALPGGWGNSFGTFNNVGYFGLWWSASEYNSNYAYHWHIIYYHKNPRCYQFDKSLLLSVRCVQD